MNILILLLVKVALTTNLNKDFKRIEVSSKSDAKEIIKNCIYRVQSKNCTNKKSMKPTEKYAQNKTKTHFYIKVAKIKLNSPLFRNCNG